MRGHHSPFAPGKRQELKSQLQCTEALLPVDLTFTSKLRTRTALRQ